MQHHEGQALTSDGLALYTQTWLPEHTPRAVMSFLPGGSEHSGRYHHVGLALTEAGYGLHMGDLRGEGKSPGIRGHVMSWDDYRRDAWAILQQGRSIAPEARQFFGGHSIGGLIALNVALDNPSGYQGVVASCPFLGVAWQPPAWKLTLGKMLSSLLPKLQMSTDLPFEKLSHDPAVVEAYRHDPHAHGKVTTRSTIVLLNAQKSTLVNAGKLQLPVLIMQGTADQVANPARTQEFYERASAGDKTLLLYEGLFHEIFNELEKDRVLKDMIAWMDAHLGVEYL